MEVKFGNSNYVEVGGKKETLNTLSYFIAVLLCGPFIFLGLVFTYVFLALCMPGILISYALARIDL